MPAGVQEGAAFLRRKTCSTRLGLEINERLIIPFITENATSATQRASIKVIRGG